MEARCWSDYLCPWCYLGQQRDEVFAAHGMVVVHLPYELHPEIPPGGRRVRPDGRLAPTLARVAAACEEVGLPFRPPRRMPNTRRALATAEWVRGAHPAAFDALHRSLFAAQFVTGDPLDDPDVLDELVRAAGAPAAEVRAAVESGEAAALVDASMTAARDLGVASTPTWVVGDLVIPGALDVDTLRRWLTRVADRAARS